MSIRALRTLHAIARHGSFGAAGAAVGLTQSAVSLQVKSLEAEFGAQLFDRSRRLPVLTEAGKIVLEKSAEVLALYDQIGTALSDEQSLAGRLKLGAIQTALARELPDALAILNRQHPRARVHVTAGMSAELSLQVANGELDAAIATEPVRPHPPDLVAKPLYQDRFWIVAPAGQGHRTAEDLLQSYPFIRFDRASWAGRMIDKRLREMRLDLHEEMVLDSQRVILTMVQKGLGVAIVPTSEAERRELDLTCVPFGTPQMSRWIVLLERQSHTGGRLGAELVRIIRDLTGGAQI